MLNRALIDENLSPTLVERLAQRGIFAQHVAHLGMAGTSDNELWKRALEVDAFVITHNPQDFIDLATKSELHAGLVLIREGGLDPDEQWARVAAALDFLRAQDVDDLLNRVVDVRAVDDIEVLAIPRDERRLLRRRPMT